MEELASSLPQHILLQRYAAVHRPRSQSPSGVLQEEVGHRATPADRGLLPRAEEEVTIAATVEGEVTAVEEEVPAVATGEEEVPAGAAVEGEIAAAVEGEEAVAPISRSNVVMKHDGADATGPGGVDDAEKHLMQQFITNDLDVVGGDFTPGVARGMGMSPTRRGAVSEMGTHFDFDMSMGAPPICGGRASTDRASSLDEVAGKTGSQTLRERMSAESPDVALDIMERERA
ncbi:hypothetical protein CBR_g27728 [Chara braunii]|uniref:Uncharacterized protein n=1 Tax=Chara braunii TaxID=69332 RepID=A0A388L860_CHABU|nr:hypothetical protein CBR_g27728 [Chara braunii]|eukprot:GBG78500.1 hypothetical protein CBR_g27728 [Chara braunii]